MANRAVREKKKKRYRKVLGKFLLKLSLKNARQYLFIHKSNKEVKFFFFFAYKKVLKNSLQPQVVKVRHKT